MAKVNITSGNVYFLQYSKS